MEKVELLERVLEGWTGPRERRDAAKSGSDASRDIAAAHIRKSMHSVAIRHDIRIHSSFVPLACDWGCTVGPGAVGRPTWGGGAGGALEVGGGGTRCGYCRLAAPAVVLAALEVNEPIVTTGGCRETTEIKRSISESLRQFPISQVLARSLLTLFVNH